MYTSRSLYAEPVDAMHPLYQAMKLGFLVLPKEGTYSQTLGHKIAKAYGQRDCRACVMNLPGG